MQSYNQAMSAYAQSAGEINNNLASYRSDVDNIKAQNKALVQSAEQTIDLNALKGLGEELAVRGFKQLASKYGTKLYEYKIPKLNQSIGDLDRNAGDRIQSAGRRALNRVRGGTTPEDVEESGEGVELQDIEGSGDIDTGGIRVNSRMTSVGGGDEVGDAPERMTNNSVFNEEDFDTNAPEGQSFEDFMNQFQTPSTSTGDIDFERSSNQINMGLEDMESRRMSSQANAEEAERGQMGAEDQDVGRPTPEAEQGEEGGENEPLNDEAEGATDMGEGATEDLGDTARSALQDATSGLEEGAGTAADEAVGGALDAVGAGLEATGVLAPLGLVAQGVGAVLEGGALYEAAKSVWDWFDDDILGNHPKPPQLAIPKQAPTLAQRGYLVTPDMSSLDEQTSYGGSF